jgi:hypothetical protein
MEVPRRAGLRLSPLRVAAISDKSPRLRNPSRRRPLPTGRKAAYSLVHCCILGQSAHRVRPVPANAAARALQPDEPDAPMTSIESLNPDIPLFARTGVNLASAGLGARAIWATDQFFAPLDRMLQDHPAEYIPGKFDDHGKWMDGWETRRRRDGATTGPSSSSPLRAAS